jgi:hypothetical protein
MSGRLPQSGQTAGGAALDGADADVERVRGVGLGQVLQVTQDDDGALARRQRAQGGENCAVVRVRDGWAGRGTRVLPAFGDTAGSQQTRPR